MCPELVGCVEILMSSLFTVTSSRISLALHEASFLFCPAATFFSLRSNFFFAVNTDPIPKYFTSSARFVELVDDTHITTTHNSFPFSGWILAVANLLIKVHTVKRYGRLIYVS